MFASFTFMSFHSNLSLNRFKPPCIKDVCNDFNQWWQKNTMALCLSLYAFPILSLWLWLGILKSDEICAKSLWIKVETLYALTPFKYVLFKSPTFHFSRHVRNRFAPGKFPSLLVWSFLIHRNPADWFTPCNHWFQLVPTPWYIGSVKPIQIVDYIVDRHGCSLKFGRSPRRRDVGRPHRWDDHWPRTSMATSWTTCHPIAPTTTPRASATSCRALGICRRSMWVAGPCREEKEGPGQALPDVWWYWRSAMSKGDLRVTNLRMFKGCPRYSKVTVLFR